MSGNSSEGLNESLPERVSLSHSQYDVLKTVSQGYSVFFTGAAGTGKSYILRILKETYERLGKHANVSFTAPTGVAACNISGLTIHSWAGIGFGDGDIEKLIEKVRKNQMARTRWKDTHVLVIDEISMLSGEIFDKLDVIGKHIRNNHSKIFGGIQLVLCGDFFQLPPIGVGKSTKFAFDSEAWQKMFYNQSNIGAGGGNGNGGCTNRMIVLNKVFRQKESLFVSILNEMRLGEVSQATHAILKKKSQEDAGRVLCVNGSSTCGGHERKGAPMSIMDTINMCDRLGGCGDEVKSMQTELDVAATAEEKVPVTIPATRLFSVNRDVDAVNLRELQEICGGVGGSTKLIQYKVRYTWETSGKEPYLNQLKQGTKAPEILVLCIGAQVMLLKNLDTSIGLVNGTRGRVVGFCESEESTEDWSITGDLTNVPLLPRVEFYCMIGGNLKIVTRILKKESWESMEGDRVMASISQVPLALAWAISIHKAQGMTLPYVEVSFQNIFEYGQAYVSISRATDLDGLILKNYDGSRVRAHDAVKKFYQHISNLELDPLKLSSNTEESRSGMIVSNETVNVETDMIFKMFEDADALNKTMDDKRGRSSVTSSTWIDTKKPSSSVPEWAKKSIAQKRANENAREERKYGDSTKESQHKRGRTFLDKFSCPKPSIISQMRNTTNNSVDSRTGAAGADKGEEKSSSVTAPFEIVDSSGSDSPVAPSRNPMNIASYFADGSAQKSATKKSVNKCVTNAASSTKETNSNTGAIFTAGSAGSTGTTTPVEYKSPSQTISVSIDKAICIVSANMKEKIEQNRLMAIKKMEEKRKQREQLSAQFISKY